jgi:mRNA-degrading endonuclease RelE of RelBE toxin-antitoxin system
MAAYQIEVTEEAKEDLDYYTASERKTIVSQIRAQLEHQPSNETRNRKKLRDSPVASWELRAGKFRIFYEVDEAASQVTIVAVGHKEHQILYIKGKEVEI